MEYELGSRRLEGALSVNHSRQPRSVAALVIYYVAALVQVLVNQLVTPTKLKYGYGF